jgi:hypothetical protein
MAVPMHSQGADRMEPEIVVPSMEAIRRWSGVECPNAAARHGLVDMAALVQDLEKLRGSLQFEDEPSSFELALQQCKEPAK